ncbi:riboflavin synthase [mine drainage metagenome]|uniref:Riboflavin synthase n=1 Tax=mine drainage metagenome TaxID=410659 RepID=A0A1J5Q8C3_9ZZZZ
MFTGIIQAIGRIEKIEPAGDDVRLTIGAGGLDMGDTALGDSIAASGVCLTVITCDRHAFQVHVSRATLSCTAGLDLTGAVNLEKALRLADRLGGHLVSGHVDGVGQVERFEPVGECMLLSIRAPHALARYIAVKGSIAVDGVSLTVNTVEHDIFSINLIPHTLKMTTLHSLGIGSLVNLEVDQVARYVERMAQWESESQGESA